MNIDRYRVPRVGPEPRDHGVRWLHMPPWMVEFDTDYAFTSVCRSGLAVNRRADFVQPDDNAADRLAKSGAIGSKIMGFVRSSASELN